MESDGEAGRSHSVVFVAGGAAAVALVVAVTLGVVNGRRSVSGGPRPLDPSTTMPTVEATPPTPGEVATAMSGIGDSSILLYATDANWRLSYDYTCATGSGELMVKAAAPGGATLVDVRGATGHGVVPGTPDSGAIRLSVQSPCQWKLTILPAATTQGG